MGTRVGCGGRTTEISAFCGWPVGRLTWTNMDERGHPQKPALSRLNGGERRIVHDEDEQFLQRYCIPRCLTSGARERVVSSGHPPLSLPLRGETAWVWAWAWAWMDWGGRAWMGKGRGFMVRTRIPGKET